MRAEDMPVFGNTTYAESVSNAANYGAGDLGHEAFDKLVEDMTKPQARRFTAGAAVFPPQLLQAAIFKPKEEGELTTRLVKVFIADPDARVPLESRLLYRGEETLTDGSDQDLFYDLDIKGLLGKHNELRKGIVDKKASEGRDKPVYLEPIKASGLRMQVVLLASF